MSQISRFTPVLALLWPAAAALAQPDGFVEETVVSGFDSPVTGPHLKGRATVGGVFYDGNKFPEELRGSLFFGEAGSPPSQTGWINRAVFDEQHELIEIAEFQPSGSMYPTGLAVDPEGYAVYRGSGRQKTR